MVRVKCEICGKDTYCGTLITKYGSTIDYEECEACGLIYIERLDED